MNDKLWLDRVDHAYWIYYNKHGEANSANEFIEWLYRQYGIVRKPHKEYYTENIPKELN